MRRNMKRPVKGSTAKTSLTAARPHPESARGARPSPARESAWEEADTPAATAEDEDEADETPAGEAAPHAEAEADDNHGPDDALGLYLRQMGAIPLLSRQQELALAQRLAAQRTRYRRATMWN